MGRFKRGPLDDATAVVWIPQAKVFTCEGTIK